MIYLLELSKYSVPKKCVYVCVSTFAISHLWHTAPSSESKMFMNYLAKEQTENIRTLEINLWKISSTYPFAKVVASLIWAIDLLTKSAFRWL